MSSKSSQFDDTSGRTKGESSSALSLRSTNFAPWRVGLSMAASWSWGSSLATGIALALTFGLPAWWFWALPNFFVIPALGLYYDRIPQLQKTIRLWPMAAFMGILQIFVLWVNTQAIFEITSGGIDLQTAALLTPTQATAFAIGTGLFFAFFIHKYGLSGSMSTDIIQYAVQAGGVGLLIVAALVLGLEFGGANVPNSSLSQMLFVASFGVGHLFSPLYSAQLWQRIEKVDEDDRIRAGLWGGFFYASYQIGVLIIALFAFTESPVFTILLLMSVLAVTTSTYDSAVSALQWLLNSRRRALVLAVVTLVSWPFFKQIGIVGIFSFYAWARTPAGLFLLLFLGYLWWKNIDIDSDTFDNLLDRGPGFQDVSLNTDQDERKSSTDD